MTTDQSRANSLGVQFSEFESRVQIEFDEPGWYLFCGKVVNFQNDLYMGARRECMERANQEMRLLYTSKDVDRAAMRLDFQRFHLRRRRNNLLQLAVMLSSLLAGVFGNWAFTDIVSEHPSILPWCGLVSSIVGATAFYHLLSLRSVEP